MLSTGRYFVPSTRSSRLSKASRNVPCNKKATVVTSQDSTHSMHVNGEDGLLMHTHTHSHSQFNQPVQQSTANSTTKSSTDVTHCIAILHN